MSTKYLAVLGRLRDISLAELKILYGDVQVVGEGLAVVTTNAEVDIARLGGTMKIGPVLDVAPIDYLRGLPAGKITLGVSDYRKKPSKNLGLELKRKVGRSMRVVPSEGGVVSGAAAHHNGLGARPAHVELAYYDGGIASVRAQDITAYARRDQARPARDAKVGMLPPKLAQILINLCGELATDARVLDPFCGTGVVLQEALLMGYSAYGTDLSERMVEYARRNLEWLIGEKPQKEKLPRHYAECNPKKLPFRPLEDERAQPDFSGVERARQLLLFEVSVGDATSFSWSKPIDAVASEVYLGAPLSNPPGEMKLRALKEETGGIVRKFLRNLARQVEAGTPVVLAVPAWRRESGEYSRLNILDDAGEMGYNVVNNLGDLLYYREGQVVAREIIVLRKS